MAASIQDGLKSVKLEQRYQFSFPYKSAISERKLHPVVEIPIKRTGLFVRNFERSRAQGPLEVPRSCLKISSLIGTNSRTSLLFIAIKAIVVDFQHIFCRISLYSKLKKVLRKLPMWIRGSKTAFLTLKSTEIEHFKKIVLTFEAKLSHMHFNLRATTSTTTQGYYVGFDFTHLLD